jgi:hypothetical protein
LRRNSLCGHLLQHKKLLFWTAVLHQICVQKNPGRGTTWREGPSAWNTDDVKLVKEIRLTVADLATRSDCRVWVMLRPEREGAVLFP